MQSDRLFILPCSLFKSPGTKRTNVKSLLFIYILTVLHSCQEPGQVGSQGGAADSGLGDQGLNPGFHPEKTRSFKVKLWKREKGGRESKKITHGLVRTDSSGWRRKPVAGA